MAVLQSLLKSYKPVSAPERIRDKATLRRIKFISALNDQLRLLDDPKATRTGRKDKVIKIKSWIVSSPDGDVLVPKLGHTPLQLAPGKAGLMLGKPDAHAVKDVLAKLVQATDAGELDGVLATAAGSRKPPTRKAKAAKAA